MRKRLTIADRRLTIVPPNRSRLSAHTLFTCIVLVLGALTIALQSGCDRKHTPTSQTETSTLRIVSFSPALSRTLVDLGLAANIVGRSPYCSSLDQSIPVVGDLNNVDYEQLVRLNPTLIVVQPPAGGVDANLVEVAKRHNWRIVDWRLNGIADIRAMVRELAAAIDEPDATRTLAIKANAEAFAANLDRALAADATRSVFGGRVLMVNAVDPVMAFGAGTYLDDVLHALGAVNAVTEKEGTGWAQLSLEDVYRLKPDAIILVKPSAKPDELTHDLGPLATIEAPAVSEHRLALLAHADAYLPSTSVVGVAEELRAILQRFAENAPAADNRK